jgi:hypothetical protein
LSLILLTNKLPGNPHRRGSLSTIDLLVLASSEELLLKLTT